MFVSLSISKHMIDNIIFDDNTKHYRQIRVITTQITRITRESKNMDW